MYQCNFCKRYFSRKQDLTQHCHQLHSYTDHSRTLNWVQDQQSSSNNNIRQKTIDNNVWNEIEGLDIFLQMTSGDDKQNNEKLDLNNAADVPIAFNEYTSFQNYDYTDNDISEYHEITQSQESKSISSKASSEDFCGVSLADAYKDLNNDSELTLWPSETYKEFMMAVTQYHLSDAATDSMLRILKKHCTDQLSGSTRKGRTFINNMDVKGLQFKEKELLTFEEEIYKLHYRPIYDAIKSLVSNSDLSKDFLFNYEEQWEYGLDGSLVRVYSKQNTADWWRERYNPFSKILAIMIYIDGTTLDTLRRKSEYPIFLTLGNIPNLRHNLPDSKVLIGFLPHLTTRDNKLRNSKEFKQKQRELKHRALKYLLGPLLKEDGIYLAINGKVEHFTIYLSSIIADMLEAQDICCTYKSYRTRCPCYKCLTPGDQLNNMNIKQDMIDLRNHENMQEAIASHNAENCSIHEYDNFFWNFRMMNIYDAAALDRMHLQEIGLFPYMLDYTRDMLMYQYGNRIISKMDNRLATITRFNNLRILKKGYQQGTKFTGGEMRDVMKIIVFVLDELYTTDNKINQNQTDSNLYTIASCKNLIICYIKFIKMYITSRKKKFNEDDLKIFEREIIDWSNDFVNIFAQFSPSGLQLPKLHMWKYHTIHTIRRYGTLNGLTTETYETLHKNWVKNPYRMSNKKNTHNQMLKT
ncbi:hypothetical protein GLOIN_2v1488639, partial [Rhizophagus irregularis DAOM 181602=DAOM 197198]